MSPLRDYQTKGIAWLVSQLKHNRAVMLADDAGLGKTVQALQAAAHLQAERILIICPAGARHVWRNEIRRWFPKSSLPVHILEPGYSCGGLVNPLLPPVNNIGPSILIVAYDEMSKKASRFHHYLCSIRWDVLILDEAHYLKNPSNRTQTIYGKSQGRDGVQAAAEKVILLTGTPTPNHAGEIWQHYRTFWPTSLGPKPLSQAQFEDQFTRFRDTVYGRQITGSKNQGLLRQRLDPFILRRRKAEVLTELPPLLLQDIPLVLSQESARGVKALLTTTTGHDDGRHPGRDPGTGLARSLAGHGGGNAVVKQEDPPDAAGKTLAARSPGSTHAGGFPARAESAGRGVPGADRSAFSLAAALTDDELLQALRRDQTQLATLRRQIGELKVTPAIRWIEERLQSTDKMIVFAWHHSVIRDLVKGLHGFCPAHITGETTPKDRTDEIARFQADPNCRLFVGQILAAGTAITLTAASEVAIVEPSWVPGENYQAISRAHRMGQRDSVLASFLYLPGTLDQRIMATFRRKAAEISELQGDNHAASHAHV